MKLIANEITFTLYHNGESAVIILQGLVADDFLAHFWRNQMTEGEKVRAIMAFAGASDHQVMKKEIGSTIILSPVFRSTGH